MLLTLSEILCIAEILVVLKANAHAGNYTVKILADDTNVITTAVHTCFGPDFRQIMSNDGGKEKKFIHILGLYELSRRQSNQISQEGLAELFAAQLAVQHINTAKILGDFQLRLYVNDTKCDPGIAVDAFFHAIFSKKIEPTVLLGSTCSEATTSLASAAQHWNIVQVSHGATSPVLRDRKAFRTFFRVVASDTSHNGARLAFIKHFQWHVVTVLSQDSKEYTLTANNLVKMLEEANISCRGTITFAENDFEDQLNLLKDLDTRIIVGSFPSKVAVNIFCKAYELDMYGMEYVWILPSENVDQWWITNDGPCSQQVIFTVLEGVIFVKSSLSVQKSDTGYSSEELLTTLKKQGLHEGRFVHESYDSVWTAALAMNHTFHEEMNCEKPSSCGNVTALKNENLTANKIFNAMSALNFVGISGPISFKGADRLGISAILQFQGTKLRKIAIFSPNENHINFNCSECYRLSWPRIPVAQRFLKLQIQTISSNVFTTVSVATAFSVLTALLFLGFNLYYRKLKCVKLSSPRLNNIAVIGCIAVYLGVFLLGFDFATNPFPSYFPAICAAKIYLFAGGFSLAFGSIFAKTYRIHNIFIRSRGGFVKKKYLQDTQLILLVSLLLVIDGLVITTWIFVDPLDRQLHNLTLRVSETDRSVIYMPQIEVCSSSYLNGWLSFIYGYKGLQLAMGVYMAWQTRHVKIPALNDSQYIGMSVYGVVITSCIVVVLANVVGERPTAAYVTISVMILTTTTATLSLLFFPKVITVFRRNDTLDPVMQSVGLKLESNTRRFPTNDAKEKLFRLEVQNRVFKRELLVLRGEIRKLERQLMTQTLSPTVSSISMEIASAKITQKDSEASQSLNDLFPLPRELPRKSWPSSDLSGRTRNEEIAFPSFQSDQHLEVQSRPKVLNRIRNLIRSRRIELKEMANQQAEQPKRKFSLTMCLQAHQDGNRDIIIDLNLSAPEIEAIKCGTKTRTDKKRGWLHHQSSVPLILFNVESSKLQASEPSSLPELKKQKERGEDEPDKSQTLDARRNT